MNPVHQTIQIDPWPHADLLTDACGEWLIAHVHPRSEKTVARLCEAHDVGHVLPLLEKQTRRPDTQTIRRSTVPLFPGYIAFTRMNDGKRVVLESNKVVQILEVPEPEHFVADMLRLRQLAQENIHVMGIEALAVGTPVRVLEGPLQGMTGVVEDHLSGQRLLIQIQAFQTSVSISLEGHAVEPFPFSNSHV